MESDRHFTDANAESGDIGAIEQNLIFEQVHPIIKADIPDAIADFQIDFILPIERITDDFAFGISSSWNLWVSPLLNVA